MARKPASESVIDMFARLGRDLHVPALDIDRVIEHHRRNLEAFEKSARAASSGAVSIFERQRSVLEETMKDAAALMQALPSAGSPQDAFKRQSEFARKTFETAVKNTGEVAGLVRESGTEAIEILRTRMREGLEEAREGFQRKD